MHEVTTHKALTADLATHLGLQRFSIQRRDQRINSPRASKIRSRRIIGFGVKRADIDDVAVCRMFNHAIAGQPLPTHISTDHDPLFRFHRWLANLRVLEIDEIKTVPQVPVSHPFVERLIGTIRRELLDRMLFWNALDLERKLQEFRGYYNGSRVHQSLSGSTPAEQAGKSRPTCAALDLFGWREHCRGLFHTPIAV